MGCHNKWSVELTIGQSLANEGNSYRSMTAKTNPRVDGIMYVACLRICIRLNIPS